MLNISPKKKKKFLTSYFDSLFFFSFLFFSSFLYVVGELCCDYDLGILVLPWRKYILVWVFRRLDLI